MSQDAAEVRYVVSVGHVSQLWRYPIKSLVGEQLDAAEVDARGMTGDRLWSVRDSDGKFGSGKTTRRFRRMDGLLTLSATYDGDVPVITFPDARRMRGDDGTVDKALTAQVGRPVSLEREEDVSHFDEGPIHLITTASLLHLAHARGAAVDPRRLRPNVLLDTGQHVGFLEDEWIGRLLAIGEQVVLSIRTSMTRCVMVELPQVELGEDSGLLQTIGDLNDLRLGVVADVVRTGAISDGDAAYLSG